MGESATHLILVQALADWAATYFRELNEEPALLCDTPYAGSQRPPEIGNHTPDLYAIGRSILLLGEAKTSRDLDTRDSREQLAEFLVHCAGCEAAILVVAVPWHMIGCAKAIFRALQRENGVYSVSVEFIPDLPG